MRRLFGLLAALTLFACGGVEPQAELTEFLPDDGAVDSEALRRRPDAGVPADAGATVRVMTWNAENFFDDVDDPRKEDTILTPAEVTAKTAALAAVVRTQSPDVLALQEVENETVLQRLAGELGLPHTALVPSYDFRGINVAVATRLPILRTVSHLGERLWAPDGSGPYRWARDCLEVHLAAPDGRELVVLVSHQTSQLDASAGSLKRQAQARRTREIADQLRTEDATRAVIIAGDMNDEPAAASIQLLVGDARWIDVATDVPDAERFSYYWRTPRRYDYLLPDEATAARRQSVTILHGPDVAAASDHAPVVATFAW